MLIKLKSLTSPELVMPVYRIRGKEKKLDGKNELKSSRELATSRLEYQNGKEQLKEKKTNLNRGSIEHLTYSDAINLRNLITVYAESPGTNIADIKESISEILKRNLQNYGRARTTREEMDQILAGLDIGKNKLYKTLGNSTYSYFSSDIKNLTKFVESRGDSLKNILLSADEGKVAFWDMVKLAW
jgi:hypothetical protein